MEMPDYMKITVRNKIIILIVNHMKNDTKSISYLILPQYDHMRISLTYINPLPNS